jgi:hypothetical protein
MVDWTPSDLGTSKCAAWFTADSLSSLSNGDSVSSWTSSEGNSISATQGTSANQPTYVASSTISGKPAVNFDGASSFDHLFFTASAMDVGTSGSLVCCFIGNANDGATLPFGVVTRGQSSSNSIQLLYTNNNTSLQPSVGSVFDTISNSNFPSGTTGTNYRSIVFGRHSGNLMMRYIGDELSDQADASSIDLGQTIYAIGSAYFSGGCEGEIAEMVYMANPTLKDIQKVEGYAAHKYSLTGSLPSDHPYKTNAPQRAVAWDPSKLSGGTLTAWYKADSISGSDGDSVSAWADSSGNGNDLSQATSSLQPSLQTNELNGKSVVRFDGSTDLLRDGDIAALDVGTGDIWMAAVFKSTDTSAEQILLEKDHTRFALLIRDTGQLQFRIGGVGNSNCAEQDAGNWSRTEFVIGTAARVSGSIDGFVNGSAADTTGVANTQSLSNAEVFDIGGRGPGASGQFDGDAAEILVGGATLNTSERQKIEGYLAHKYALMGNLPADHPYRHIKPIIKISNAFSSGLIDGGLIQA